MDYLSHPDRLLVEHLESVKRIGMDIYASKKNLRLPFDDRDMRIALSNMLFYHDIGKSTKFFQEYLRSSIKNMIYTGKDELKRHALISAVYAAYKTYTELEGNAKSVIPMVVFLAVRKHHGNLDDIKNMLSIGKHDWKFLQIQWENLNFDCVNKSNNLDFKDAKEYVNDLPFVFQDIETSLDNYFLLNSFFSILTYSDKNDAKFHHQTVCDALPADAYCWVDKYKADKFKDPKSLSKINIVRNEIYDSCAKAIVHNSNRKIFSINVPTGSGKTLAGINAALKMIGRDKSIKKIIYALPFTSIVEQTYHEIFSAIKCNAKNPEDYLVEHHHLAEAKIKNDENYYGGSDAQFIIENWDKPIILTTFWQLFNTLISNQNKTTRKFHNIANSIIILDEIQTMPIEYWELIRNVLINVTDILHCKIIFMTATMPKIFHEEKNEIFPLTNGEQTLRYFSLFSRYELKTVNNLEPITVDSLCDIALEHIAREKDKSFMFVFNTIKSSKKFYNGIKSCGDVIYLSGNIVPKDRLKRINNIKQAGRKIVVSTQLVEAGVDIDFDRVYRDFAPFDCIVQAAGRCNRNNRHNQQGEVLLTKLKDSKNGKLYCNYIYKPLALELTNNLLKEFSSVKESDLLTVMKSYYDKTSSLSSSDVSKDIIEDITNLKYTKVSSEFELIKNIPNVLVFVEKDETASNILDHFKRILKIDDRWERKDEFLKIKKSFYDYVLSVNLSKSNIDAIKDFEDIGNFKVITKMMINTFYDDIIGFNYDYNNFI